MTNPLKNKCDIQWLEHHFSHRGSTCSEVATWWGPRIYRWTQKSEEKNPLCVPLNVEKWNRKFKDVYHVSDFSTRLDTHLYEMFGLCVDPSWSQMLLVPCCNICLWRQSWCLSPCSILFDNVILVCYTLSQAPLPLRDDPGRHSLYITLP